MSYTPSRQHATRSKPAGRVHPCSPLFRTLMSVANPPPEDAWCGGQDQPKQQRCTNEAGHGWQRSAKG
jgi:hypothetical protein